MRFFKYIETIPAKPIIDGVEGEFQNGDEIKVRKGSLGDYRFEIFKVAADGSIVPSSITAVEWDKLSQMTQAEITKLLGLKTQQAINEDIEAVKTYTDEKVKQTVSETIPINGTVLPRGVDIPEWVETNGKAIIYGRTGGTTYTNTGGTPASFLVPEGYMLTIFYDKTTDVWSGDEADVVELPNLPVDGEIVENDTSAISGGTAYKAFNPAVRFGRNLIDTSTFQSGYIATNGNFTSSINWIHIPYDKIPEELKGQEVTISGIGAPGSGGNIVSFRNSSNIYLEGIPGQGIDTPSSITVTVPLNADNWGFTLTNDSSDGGIGSRLTDNQFVNSFMVNIGNTPLPYEPNKAVLRHEAIDNPDDIKYTNLVTEEGTGAVPSSEVFKIKSKIDGITVESPNIVNYATDFEYGYYNTNGNPTASVNWLRTKPVYFSQPVLDRLANDEEIKLSVNGGGLVSSSASLVSFFSDSGVVISNILGTGTNSFPISPIIPLNAVGYKGTIVNEPEIDINNNGYINLYQAEIGDEPTRFQPYGAISIDPSKIPVLSFDTSEVLLTKVDENNLQIFYHIGGENDLWLRINLIHQIIPAKYTDVWRIDAGYIVKRVGEGSFITVQQVIDTGVYENAIYTSGYGYSDALGSAHGCEILDEFGIFMDGARLDIATMSNTVIGRYLTFTTRTFFKTPNGIDDVGVSFKKWDIKEGLLTLSNNIQWTPVAPIVTDGNGRTYLGMLSILRDLEGNQITHTAFSNEDGKYYDVSETGFETPIFTDLSNPRRTKIVIWGDEFKAEVTVFKKEVTLADGTVVRHLPKSGMFVQNNTLYNKVYPKFGATTIQTGDFWESVTEYKFSNIKKDLEL